VFYIMTIPQSDRDELLRSNSDSDWDDDDDNDDLIEINLLEKIPGKVTYLKNKDIQHNLEDFNLFSRTSGTVIKELNSLYVKNAVFSDKSYNFSFLLEDLSTVDNSLLTFNTKKGTGILTITLNGNEVVQSKLIPGQNNPIKLSNEFLQNENVLVFSVSSVGVAFWNTNEYLLENIQVTGDITDVSTQASQQTFVVDSFEKENLEKVTLVYYPDCKEDEVGLLKVNVNNCKAFTGVPACNQLSKHQLPNYCLNEGENIISMDSEDGHYLMTRVQLRTDLKETRELVYDFYLNETQFRGFRQGNFVNLSLRFADPEETKDARLIINGKETVLNTRSASYDSKLNVYLTQGSNVIKIIPKNDFYIAELKVDYFERD